MKHQSTILRLTACHLSKVTFPLRAEDSIEEIESILFLLVNVALVYSMYPGEGPKHSGLFFEQGTILMFFDSVSLAHINEMRSAVVPTRILENN